jgi:hypothetical protein
MLSNNVKQVVAWHNDQAFKALQQGNQKKKVSAPQLTESDILADYKYLPFQASDIVQLYPVTKHLEFKNADVMNLMVQG